MLPFSTTALLLLLPWSGGLVTAEVVGSFQRCQGFFYQATPPRFKTEEQYTHICQFYQDDYRFATLYSKRQRAPLYSAYKTSVSVGNLEARGDNWMYEPQLAGETGKAMRTLQLNPPQTVSDSQAVLEDYRGTMYEQGHLNPNQHHGTQVAREATFTLTNIVPQRGDSNRVWAVHETNMMNRFREFCNGVAYVITGVIPYDNVVRQIHDRVSVPEYLWSAYCCPAFRADLTKAQKVKIPTYAAVGRNDPDSPNDIVQSDPAQGGFNVRELSLAELESILVNRLRVRKITLFNNNCQGQTG